MEFGLAAAVSFGAIFVAEFGDKSQLLVLAFATRHPARPVVAGVVLAAALIQGVSVAVGALAGAALPERLVGLVASAAFIAVAAWTLLGHDEAEDDPAEVRATAGRRAAGIGLVLMVAGTFVVGEIGDKTMLATFALAASQGPIPTWVGSTAGEVSANVVAVFVGRQFGQHLPPRALRIGSAALFGAAAVVVIGGALG